MLSQCSENVLCALLSRVALRSVSFEALVSVLSQSQKDVEAVAFAGLYDRTILVPCLAGLAVYGLTVTEQRFVIISSQRFQLVANRVYAKLGMEDQARLSEVAAHVERVSINYARSLYALTA